MLNALRQGAEIRLWINGPAVTLAKHYIPLDRIIEGGSAVVDALAVGGSVGLARVQHEQWEYVVVLPDGGPPLIARATATP